MILQPYDQFLDLMNVGGTYLTLIILSYIIS